VKLLVLVLRNQWPCSRCVRSPDLEADARPHVYAARALWGVGPDEAVGHPNLQINRSEVIADQTTSRRRLITAAEAHGRSRVAAAGVGGRLSFEIANRADRPLADLVDRRQIAVESVTAGDRVIGGAAIASRLGVDVVEEVRRRHPVVAQIREGDRRFKGPVVRIWRELTASARTIRRREGEGRADEPAAADVPGEVDRLDEGVGVDKAAARERRAAGAAAVRVRAAGRVDVEGLHHRSRIGGTPEVPAGHPEQRYGLGDRGQDGAVSAGSRGRGALISGALAVVSAGANCAEVRGFQTGVDAGRWRSTQRQTNGGAVQAVLERSSFHCRGRACNAAYSDRRETSHCNLSQSGHLPLQCFVPNTSEVISHGACLVGTICQNYTLVRKGHAGPGREISFIFNALS
jgi:hypothetical protein